VSPLSDYCRSHGIDELQLAWCGVKERDGRLLLPNGRSLSLNGAGPKALQPSGVPLTVWWPESPPEDGQTVLVCEGESDALAAQSAIGLSELQHQGRDSDPLRIVKVAAVPGTGYPAERLAEELRGAGTAVLAFDGDTAGWEATARAAAALHAAGIACHDLAVPDGHDLADLLAQLRSNLRVAWLAERISDARPVPIEEMPNATALRDLAFGISDKGPRFTTRKLNPSDFRPVEFAWKPRIVSGVLNVLAGNEGIGKGTLLSWAIAQLTRGELPGQFHDNPARVLWVGDEDSWNQVVGPRLHAAGADLDRVEELTANDGQLFNVHADAAELDQIVQAGPFDVVVFEALLDNMPAGRGGDLSQHVRSSLAPTRAVLRRRNATALATMHPRKGQASTFRELLAGSHQYNALSRSSLLLAMHPDDPDRRVVVPGKQNYSRAAVTESFELIEHLFDLNGDTFTVSLARAFRPEPDITFDSLNASARTDVRDSLADKLLAVLSAEPQQLKAIAERVGRDPTDGTVRRALAALEEAGRAERPGRGLWQLTTPHVA